MMSDTLKVTIALGILLVFSSCTSITVEPISPDTQISPDSDTKVIQGQRFSLPRPYIQMKIQDDGTHKAEILYLPDPEHTYAVDSFNFFANAKLDVTTKDEMLTVLNWTGDSSAVLADTLKSAGDIAKSVLEAKKQEQAERMTKENTAVKAVDDAQLEFDQAQAKIDTLLAQQPPVPSATILEARIAVQSAELKLNAAKAALARIRGESFSDEAFNLETQLRRAQNELSRRITRMAVSNDILMAQLTVYAIAAKLSAEKEDTHRVKEVFGPKLFAIHEEVRMSANGLARVPFLEIVTVQQKRDPSQPGWNDPQPKYPVKWLDGQ